MKKTSLKSLKCILSILNLGLTFLIKIMKMCHISILIHLKGFPQSSVGQGLDHHLEPWSSRPPSPHLDGEGRGDQGPGGK